MTALDAARAGDWNGCLTALLAAWREHRAPVLAEAIDRASARARVVAVTPKTIAARIATADDADIGPIVELIKRQLRTQPSAGKHALELARARPPDPRIATVLAGMFRTSPYAGERGPLDRDVLDALDAIDDPRYRELIIEAAARYQALRGRLARQRDRIDHLIDVASRVAERSAPAPFAIDRELAELLARAPERRDVAALFAAVYADPADTAARVVLGDALLEQGDPRGEFIALQCARDSDAPPSRRERALIATHGRAWLGAAEPLLQKHGVVYRRGFAACARLARRPDGDDPVWQTIEELDVGGAWGDDFASWLPTLRALRRVWGIVHYDLPRLLAEPRPWTTLGMRGSVDRIAFRRLLAAHTHLPELVELDLATDRNASMNVLELARSPLAAQLRRVRIAVGHHNVRAVPGLLQLGFRELELVEHDSFPPLAEGPSVVLAAGHATLVARAPRDVDYLSAVARELPTGAFATASIMAPEKTDLADLHEELELRGVQRSR